MRKVSQGTVPYIQEGKTKKRDILSALETLRLPFTANGQPEYKMQ